MSSRILGLDPGSRRTGYGLITVSGDRHRLETCGVIELPDAPLPERLKVLHAALADVYRRAGPCATVVEKIFFAKNADSAFKLGHARGVCLLAAAEHGTSVHEYAARFVKKCITGSGAAAKEQVQLLVVRILNVQGVERKDLDASDALALALTHARQASVADAINRSREGIEL